MPRISKDKKTVETDQQSTPAKSQQVGMQEQLQGPHFPLRGPGTATDTSTRIQQPNSCSIETKEVDDVIKNGLPQCELGDLLSQDEHAKREAARRKASAKADELRRTIDSVMDSFDDDEAFGAACDQYQTVVQEFAALAIAERIRQYCHSLGMNDAERTSDLEQLDVLEKKQEVADNIRTWLLRSNLGFRHNEEYRQLFAERCGRPDAPGGRFVLKRYGNNTSDAIQTHGRITNWPDVVGVIAEPSLGDVMPFSRR